jgi:hypothetical protein
MIMGLWPGTVSTPTATPAPLAEPQTMTSSTLSILAFIVSLLALGGAVANYLFQAAQKRSERYAAVEWQLISHPAALKFYGIDKRAAEDQGVEVDQIVYLSALVTVLIVESDALHMSLVDYMDVEWRTYWRKLWEQPETRLTWNYSRKLHSIKWRAQINNYLNVNHGWDIPAEDEELAKKSGITIVQPKKATR